MASSVSRPFACASASVSSVSFLASSGLPRKTACNTACCRSVETAPETPDFTACSPAYTVDAAAVYIATAPSFCP